MLTIGDPAPDFTLVSDTGDRVSLHEFRGSQVVLYFYPKDETPFCTTEARGFRDAHAAFTEAGAVVLGVSPDSPTSHQNFIRKHKLPFRLLSDGDGTAQRAYGVDRPIVGRWLGPRRQTFIIDRDGTIKGIFRKLRVRVHAQEVLDVLRS